MLQVLVVNSFLFLGNSPLNESIDLPVDGHLQYFRCGAVINKVA